MLIARLRAVANIRALWKASRMKAIILLGAAFLASGCSAQVPSASEKLMDKIEQQVRLPEGASPLQHYARHYAFQQDGKVIGVYVLRAPTSSQEGAEQATDYGCEEMAIDSGNVVGKSVPCPPEPEPQNELDAGSRRWFSDYAKLPMIMDGGCGIVTVRFDPGKHVVEHASCNGET